MNPKTACENPPLPAPGRRKNRGDPTRNWPTSIPRQSARRQACTVTSPTCPSALEATWRARRGWAECSNPWRQDSFAGRWSGYEMQMRWVNLGFKSLIPSMSIVGERGRWIRDRETNKNLGTRRNWIEELEFCYILHVSSLLAFSLSSDTCCTW